MGSIHNLTRYIPNIAKTATVIKLFIEKDKHKTLDWKPDHIKAFNQIWKIVSEITENKGFDQNFETREVCEAFKLGLGAALEHFTTEGWVAISYASRFINSLEKFVGIVWNTSNTTHHRVIDHRALNSAINAM